MNIEKINKCQMCGGDFVTDNNVVRVYKYRKSFRVSKIVCHKCYQEGLRGDLKFKDSLRKISTIGLSVSSVLLLIVAVVSFMEGNKILGMLFVLVVISNMFSLYNENFEFFFKEDDS